MNTVITVVLTGIFLLTYVAIFGFAMVGFASFIIDRCAFGKTARRVKVKS